jgi:hypothetical protein
MSLDCALEKKYLVLTLLVVLPAATASLRSAGVTPDVWVVLAGPREASLSVAAETFAEAITNEGFETKEVPLCGLGQIPLRARAIVVIAHGMREGLSLGETVQPWFDLTDALRERDPGMIILLACHSPSDTESGIFGFGGWIDAEAGALIATWKIAHRLLGRTQTGDTFARISDAQASMRNPLGSFVYFVHGFHGSNDQFGSLISQLEDWETFGEFGEYDGYGFFDYFDDYCSHSAAHSASIEEFADNFRNQLINDHPPGTQIDIVAHSLGGLIARQMLMTSRQTLASYGVEVARVITLGDFSLRHGNR